MTTTTTPPTTPPAPGYYWQRDGDTWRQVRPLNWWQLAQYAARQRAKTENER